MPTTTLKVGDLARRTGVTVRTLHHYHEIGLLTPASRSGSGHRLYDEAGIRRLQQIVSLRQIGLALEDIAIVLADPKCTLAGVLRRHITHLDDQVTRQRALQERLERIVNGLETREGVEIDDLLHVIEETIMYDQYYSPEQQAKLAERRAEVGPERIEQVQAEWKELFARFDAEMKRGTDPADESALILARQARSLIDEFTGADPGIENSVANVYRGEGGGSAVMAQHGWKIDPGVFAYMQEALKALPKEPS